MRIEVTAEDIENGQHGDDDGCMVVLSLNRQTGLKWRVGTYAASTDLGRCYCDRVQVTLPVEVEEQIFRFDECLPVVPFEFDFDWYGESNAKD